MDTSAENEWLGFGDRAEDGKPLDEKPLFYQVVDEFREGALLTTTSLRWWWSGGWWVRFCLLWLCLFLWCALVGGASPLFFFA